MQTRGRADQGSRPGRSLDPLAARPSSQESQVPSSPDLRGPLGGVEGRSRNRGATESLAGPGGVSHQARRDFDEHLNREWRQRHSKPGGDQEPVNEHDDSAPSAGSARDRPSQAAARQSGESQPADPRGRDDHAHPIAEEPRRDHSSSVTTGPTRSDGSRLADHGGGGTSSSRVRSRSRHQRHELSAFHSDLPEVVSCEDPNSISEDFEVGCLPNDLVDYRGGVNSGDVCRGCFAWTNEDSSLESDMPASNFFSMAADECLEIQMTVAPRDVHRQRRNGVFEWVLNQKPKKNAEVSFKKLTEEQQQEMKQAMTSEINSFLEKEAIDICLRHGVEPQKLLTMRWVLTYKPVVDDQGQQVGTKPKARLIIRGFEDPNLLTLRRDSPTLALSNRNSLLALSAIYKWPVFAGDIKTAFLNGDELPQCEQLFGDPPPEARQILNMKDHEILRIKKVIYGLLHAPRAWMDKLASVLASHGWQRSRLEQCVWRLFDQDGNLCGLLGCHVDDILCSGSGSWFEERIQLLRNSFPFGSWQKAQEESITFCGCEVSQDGEYNIFVTQERYALGLSEIPVSVQRKKDPSQEATGNECKQLRAALGGLSWRATQSCPWLAASVSVLQGCQKSPRVEHLLQVNKLIREQRHRSEVALKFSSAIEKPILITYTDASWACRQDESSQGGQLTLLADMGILQGKRSEYSLLSWQSRKLSRVARSSTSAEVQMASNATDTHEFSKQVLLEWFNPQKLDYREMEMHMQKVPSVLIMDSKNLYDAMSRIETSGLQLEEKRVAIEILSIRERTSQTGILVKWCDSDQQLADGLSKPFHYDQLIDLLSLGVVSVVFDPLFVSAKRKRQMQRQERLEKTQFASSEDSRNQCQKEKGSV